MTRTRSVMAVTVLFLVAAALALGELAKRELSGSAVDLGVIELRLGFNPGVAFGLGGALPGGVVLAITAALIAGLGSVAWRAASAPSPVTRIGLVALLGGALANLVDRAADGVVTDYLHTGWFPTFNLPDVLICCGAAAVAIAAARDQPMQQTP